MWSGQMKDVYLEAPPHVIINQTPLTAFTFLVGFMPNQDQSICPSHLPGDTNTTKHKQILPLIWETDENGSFIIKAVDTSIRCLQIFCSDRNNSIMNSK